MEKDTEILSVLPAPDQEKARQFLAAGRDAFNAADYSNAETHLWTAIAADPSCSDAWQLLGMIARQQSVCVAASAMLRRAVELAPENADAWMNLGESLQNYGRMEEAERCHMKAITINPKMSLAWNNVAVIWENRGEFSKAERAMRRALELEPTLDMPRINLTRLYMQAGKPAKALEEAEIAIKTCDHVPQAHFNYALCLIQNGHWLEGWREYEHRWKLPGFIADNPPAIGPCWNGSDPKGKTILLFAEQGYGDTLQFIRYAKPIADAGGRVLVVAQDKMTRLIQHAPGVTHCFGRSEGTPTFDYCAPLMSLPYLFQSTPETVTAGKRYLSPPVGPMWQERIESLPDKRIGICWAGSPKHANDRMRSMKTSDLAALADVPGVTWVSLQFDRHGDESEIPLPLIDYAVDCNDFLDSSQLIDQLDMVVTVDTSVAHLAGALGKACVMLLPHCPDFRWLLDTDYTPWYPSIRIVRKPVQATWKKIIGQLADELTETLAEPVAA